MRGPGWNSRARRGWLRRSGRHAPPMIPTALTVARALTVFATGVVLLGTGTLAGTRPAAAATGVTTFTVTTTVDSPLAATATTSCRDSETTPECSLRAAVQAADHLATPVRIDLGGHDYQLTDSGLGSLAVTDPAGIDLVGTGPASTVISVPSGRAYSVVLVTSTSAGTGDLSASKLTLSGGDAKAGGAIDVNSADAAVTLSDVKLSGDKASLGGAIYDAGSVRLTDVRVNRNSAHDGGGVAVVGGKLSMSGGSVSRNTAHNGLGGGIYAKNGSVTLRSVSVTRDDATGSAAGAGGGLYATGSTVSTRSSSFESDQAAASGGGVFLDGTSKLKMNKGSVSSDTVTSSGNGGGIYDAAPSVTLTDVDVSSNSVPNGNYGGGIFAAASATSSPSAPDVLHLSGGDVSTNANGGVFVNGLSGGAVHVTVASASITANTASARYGCGAGVCVNMPVGATDVEITLTGDKVDDNVENGGLDAAGGVQVESAGTGSGATLTMSGDTVTGNTTSSKGGCGGVCVDLLAGSTATADISSSTISSNSAPDGHGGGLQLTAPTTGAPSSIAATLAGDTIASNTSGSPTESAGIGGGMFVSGDVSGSVTGTSFTSNRSLAGPSGSGNGGAVYDTGHGTMSYVTDGFASNYAGGTAASGGAAVLMGGTATFAQSSFTGNTSGKAAGAVYAAAADVSVTGSTFAGNVAGASTTGGAAGTGGAIDVGSGTFSAENVTFNANEALANGSTAGEGGAIFEIGGSTELDYVTIDGNRAGYGAGLFEVSSAALGITLHASIVTQNTSSAGSEDDCSYVMGAKVPSSTGDNVLGQSGCVGAAAPGDVTSISPGLSPLGSNGGSTETMALEAGSPALAIGTLCLATDQRGTARPATACDAGAYELTP